MRGLRGTLVSRRALPIGLLEEAVRGVFGAVKEVVPSDAQIHLLAAQRELILAVAAIIEHHADGDGDVEAEPATSARAGSSSGSPPRKRSRRTRTQRPTRVSLD